MKNNEQWISVSDLMAALMMIFLFISILLLVKEQDQIKDIKMHKNPIKKVERLSKRINKSLDKEFIKDFKKWGARRLDDGTIRFQEPKIMFSQGSSLLKKRFKKILKNFCPRYIKILQSKAKDIHEVRIIGHSSSEWYPDKKQNLKKKRHGYVANAKLSFKRAFNVHKYCYDSLTYKKKSWFSRKAVTVGANNVHPKKDKGKEDKLKSRRVEFRYQLKALSKLREDFMKTR